MTEYNIEIREPEEKDLDDLNRIMKDQWDYHYELDSVYYAATPKIIDIKSDYIDKKDVHVLIASISSTPVGFIVFLPGLAEHGDTKIVKFMEVYELIVDDNYRGYGIGRKLMEAAERNAKGLGYEWMKLYCSSVNDNALGFYKNLGYSDRQRLLFKRLD